MQDALSLTTFRGLQRLRGFIRGLANESSFYTEVAEDLVLAVDEAATNAMKYSGRSEVRVHCQQLADGLLVDVEDGGVFRRKPPSEPGGFGIGIMQTLVDEFSISPGTRDHPGTTVRLVKWKVATLKPSSPPRKGSWQGATARF